MDSTRFWRYVFLLTVANVLCIFLKSCLHISCKDRKHMFVNTFLKPGLHISRKDRKHIVANMYFKLYRYDLVSKLL